MTKETSTQAVKSDAQTTPEIDHDNDEIFEDSEMLAIPDSVEKESIRRDARRKIEIYWEKKRLREQFDDFDESEFGF
jgi:hypothetical protein